MVAIIVVAASVPQFCFFFTSYIIRHIIRHIARKNFADVSSDAL